MRTLCVNGVRYEEPSKLWKKCEATKVNEKCQKDKKLKGLMQSMMEKMKQVDYTMDQAFQRIEYACMEEYKGRYYEAIKYLMEADQMLRWMAQKEKGPRIQTLLGHKRTQIVEWITQLAIAIQRNTTRSNALRIVQPIAINVKYQPIKYSYKNLEQTQAQLMVYTPLCCSPHEFATAGHRLQCVQNQRKPRIMVVITMYNEDQKQLQATIRKLCNNMLYLQEHGLPGYDTNTMWKDLFVVIVSDGREKAHKGTLQWLSSVGLYDEDALNIMSSGVKAKCHLFEHTLQMQKDDSTSFPPLQAAFALKEKNAGKLDSHLWYFEAFAEQIMPHYTFLLDVGTMPKKSSFRKLLLALETNPQIGGVCGEIVVDKPLHDKNNWVVAAQHFEYKISNILDKPFESCFGFISVLPGAFSAYRYKAIRGAPLQAYFKSLTTPMRDLGPFEANMYLAEDRILCFELIARKECHWTLHYVKDAIARTDVPTNLIDLVGQRRRWLNGSFFATLFALWNWGRICKDSNHSMLRKIFLLIQFMYNALQVIFSWFAPANFYLALYFVIFQGFQENRWNFIDTSSVSPVILDGLPMVFNILYAVAIFTQVTIGLGNKPKHVQRTHYFISILLGIVMLLASLIAIAIFMTAHKTFEAIVLTILIFGTCIFGSALYGEVHHILSTIVQYTALMPTFVNILMVYSFCNLHDLSWGTKGIDTRQDVEFRSIGTNYKDVVAHQKALEDQRTQDAKCNDDLKQRFDSFRSSLLLGWVLSNMAMVLICVKTIGAMVYLPILYTFIGVVNGFRLLGCMGYLAYHTRQRICSKRVAPIPLPSNDSLVLDIHDVVTPYVQME